MAVNHITLDGRLAADPAEKTVGETVVKELTIAQDSGKNGDDVAYFNVEVWGGWAENLNARKGDPVFLVGRLLQKSWTDPETNEKRSRVVVRADQIKRLIRGQGKVVDIQAAA